MSEEVRQDFSPTIAKWRQIDLTAYFGERHTSDPRIKHLSIVSLTIFAIIFSLIYCVGFYVVNAIWKRNDKVNNDYRLSWKLTNYTLSTFHATLSVLGFFHMTFVSCDKVGETIFSDPTCLDVTSPGMEIFLMLTFAYFAMDCVSGRLIWPKFGDFAETFFHHVFGFVGILTAYQVGRLIGTVTICVLFTEISTPFLNVMNMFRLLKLTGSHSKAFDLNSVLLAISFFFSRVIFYGYVLFFMVVPAASNTRYADLEKEIGWFQKKWAQAMFFLFVGLYVINLYWFYKLIRGYLRIK